MLKTVNPGKISLPSRLLNKSNSRRQCIFQDHHQSGTSADLPSGKKILNIGGSLPVKQQTCSRSNVREIMLPLVRKPLSPVNSALSSKANIQAQNFAENAAPRKTPPPTNKTTPVKSPAKIFSAHDEDENRTPRTMPVPLPTTPPTVSVAMQAATPAATPSVPCSGKDVEYSFEERRASFILPKSYLSSLLQL
ncbi:hypothetical protein U1Q18_036062 [Sarracenia purpurea var. burkii]